MGVLAQVLVQYKDKSCSAGPSSRFTLVCKFPCVDPFGGGDDKGRVFQSCGQLTEELADQAGIDAQKIVSDGTTCQTARAGKMSFTFKCSGGDATAGVRLRPSPAASANPSALVHCQADPKSTSTACDHAAHPGGRTPLVNYAVGCCATSQLSQWDRSQQSSGSNTNPPWGSSSPGLTCWYCDPCKNTTVCNLAHASACEFDGFHTTCKCKAGWAGGDCNIDLSASSIS